MEAGKQPAVTTRSGPILRSPSSCHHVEGIHRVSLFTITVIATVVCLLFGVIAIVRGRLLTGFLAVAIAIAIAGFGFRETMLDGDAEATPTLPAVTLPATPEP
jgi:hypothetical protein